MARKGDRPLLEAFLTNAESFADSFIDNEAAKSVPVVGTAFKLVKGIDEIRSKVLAKKLCDFLANPQLQSEDAKEKIREKVQASPEEATKVGEVLFLVLERIVDLRKPELLSRVFLAYLNEDIDSQTVHRLSEAIDSAFAGDLEALHSEKLSQETLETLAAAGLARIEHSAVYGGFDSMDYCLTSHGKTLQRILRKYASGT